MPPSPPQTLCDPPPHLRDPCQVFSWASGSPLQAGSSLADSEDPFPRWCLGGGGGGGHRELFWQWGLGQPPSPLGVCCCCGFWHNNKEVDVCARELWAVMGWRGRWHRAHPEAVQALCPGLDRTLSRERGGWRWGRRGRCWAPHTHMRAGERAWAQGSFHRTTGS